MTSFAIKMIAAASMLIDHVGLIFFPGLPILRILGRLAFPIYAFCIAQGFLHTRNRKRYFLQVFILGAVCQLVYFLVDGSVYLGVLISFSLSIVLMWAVDRVKKAEKGSRLCPMLFLAGMLAAAGALCSFVEVDYGFPGMLLPVLLFAGEDREKGLALFTAGLLLLCVNLGTLGGFQVQWYSLLTLPLLYLYNGQRGKYSLKYFFYIFYPTHLAALYLLDMVL